ncbi:MAG TPA: trypsin-like peptidase domain-containing protein [Baekduia sp.]|uniref:S1C family serine protease n=1 Tax=Baekduia sp. TaxID=2600305 RepID=UPI002D77FD21|nr:trypsin-like peptidase domain-containing protein [Baekduia sp.]HET6506233.1 trypsin-like peptidase domain-containing protein [Baekduia sp.]
MTLPSKLAAVGACALIAGAGGAGVAAVTTNGHGSSDTKTITEQSAAGTAQPVSAPATDNTAKNVYDDAKDAVTYISAQTAQGTATGSGFVVSSDGKIITNEHVIDGATSVSVKLGTGGKSMNAQVLAANASKDLALLKVDASNLKYLHFGDSSSLQVGDNVYAIGNPYGLDHTLTSGIVSALDRDIQAPDGATISGAIQTDAALNPGNSGGPLLDTDGNVVGVNSQIATSGSTDGGEPGNVGIGFAIPAKTVQAFVDHPTSTSSQQDEQAQLAQQQQEQQYSPWGDQQSDPYGYGQQVDPYGQQQQVDPSQVNPYALVPQD